GVEPGLLDDIVRDKVCRVLVLKHPFDQRQGGNGASWNPDAITGGQDGDVRLKWWRRKRDGRRRRRGAMASPHRPGSHRAGNAGDFRCDGGGLKAKTISRVVFEVRE